jgi:hypothetical protein
MFDCIICSNYKKNNSDIYEVNEEWQQVCDFIYFSSIYYLE